MENGLKLLFEQARVANFHFLVLSSYNLSRITARVLNDRRDFGAYARRAVRRLTKNMEQTSSSVLSTKWLAGARIIYDAVRSRRHAVGKDTKSFADWIGLQQYSRAVDIGMSAA